MPKLKGTNGDDDILFGGAADEALAGGLGRHGGAGGDSLAHAPEGAGALADLILDAAYEETLVGLGGVRAGNRAAKGGRRLVQSADVAGDAAPSDTMPRTAPNLS